jgi:hypothetical protein
MCVATTHVWLTKYTEGQENGKHIARSQQEHGGTKAQTWQQHGANNVLAMIVP